jgi:polysaccharide export outer membrane protein
MAALALGACATPRFTPGPELTLVDATELPPPASVNAATGAFEYRIGPFDKLAITVFGAPELTQEEVQTDGSGHIVFPLLGDIDARGKTPAQLATEIQQGLRARYMRDPRVTVNVREVVSQVITVDGQVTEPGLYPVTTQMTLMRAIARARGTTDIARLQDVVVFRTVGEQRMAALYNLDAIRRGMYPDPAVYANDVVIVGASPTQRLIRNLIQAGGLIVTPIVAVLQRI